MCKGKVNKVKLFVCVYQPDKLTFKCLLLRSCVGSKVGDRCVVCHTPAWVKDIQSNRQLSSIIELFCGLERLLDPISQEGGHTISIFFIVSFIPGKFSHYIFVNFNAEPPLTIF